MPGADAGPPRRGTRPQAWDDLCDTATYRSTGPGTPRQGAGQPGAVPTPVVDLDQFIRSLIQVRLMERVEVQAFLERFPIETRPSEAEPLARELVRARRLTEYQAGALLQGKSRGLAIGNYLVLDKLGSRRHGHGVQGPAPPDEARRRAQGAAPLVRQG